MMYHRLMKRGVVNMAKVEKHGDKTKIAIQIMEANVGKSYEEVSQMIADTIGVDLNRAKVYYRHKVINGIAKGYDPNVRPWEKRGAKEAPASKAKAVAAKKAKPEPKAKPVKAPKATGRTAKSEDSAKSAEDLAAIKAANLKRMQDVSAKLKSKKPQYMKGQYSEAPGGVPDGWTAEGARAEVDQMYKDLDSFEMPKFLTKDAVKQLV
jgi:hypothetical protein